LLVLRDQSYKRFKHSFSPIRAKTAELEPIEKLELLYNKELFLSLIVAKGNTFSFSSFHELYKCAVLAKARSLFFVLPFEERFPYIYGICTKIVHKYKHFKHSFGSIRAILAELEAFLNFNFSTFYEPYKCDKCDKCGVSRGLGCGLGCGHGCGISEVPHANSFKSLKSLKSFKSVKYGIHLTCHIYKQFEHCFGLIRAVLAELEAF
jgi:hypothetical protein